MVLSAGTRLGPYEIIAAIGAGGMGEVYRARDTRLDRNVALKVLPEIFTADADRLARFQREAKVLASLNHPNIAAIYGLEESGDTKALVLELVEGPTLADRVARGGMPLDEVLSIARQIADALEAAHEAGIVHRDLKPANIKVRPDGVVKVLDFGLAKAFAPDKADSNLTNSPTLSVAATRAGVILGTVAYMSPEQARGHTVDKRTDIWAFGCVLYEMLTGQRAFRGGDVADTLAGVLKTEPDWQALAPATPQPVLRLLRRSLEKDRRARLPDIGIARFEIDDALAPPASGGRTDVRGAIHVRPLWQRAIPIVLATSVVSALAAGAAWTLKPSPPLSVSRSRFALPGGQQLAGVGQQIVAISADGTRMAYAAIDGLYVLADLEARPISGVEPLRGGIADPVFSPDGTSMAFYQNGALKRISSAGGTPVLLCNTEPPLGLSWGADGIVFGQAGKGIMRVAPSGGAPELLIAVTGDEVANAPQVLPGGRAVVFSVATGTRPDRWNAANIVVQRLDSAERKPLIQGGNNPRYLPTGHLVYAVGGDLWAVPFDAGRLELIGASAPIIQGVARGAPAVGGGAQFSTSDTGSLVFVSASFSQDRRVLVLMDRTGGVEPLKLPPDGFDSPRVSPDGSQVAYGLDDGKEASIWIYPLSGTNAPRRLTFGGNSRFPVWSGDGQRLAFQSDRDGDLGIFWQRADGTDTPARLTNPSTGTSHIPESWWRTGDRFTFSAIENSGASLWTVSLPDRKATPFGSVRSSGPLNSAVSPNGQWIAYTLRSGGTANIYVAPFPATAASYQISRANGHHPVWMPDGTLSYRSLGNEQVVVAFSSQPSLEIGDPVRLPGDYAVIPFAGPRNYDVLPAGQRFIAAAPAGSDSRRPAQTEIHIVQNWFEELKRLVPRK